MGERSFPLPPELGRLSTFIDYNIERLAGSSDELRFTALYAAKHLFDWALETEKSSKPHLRTLLTTLTHAAPPQTRSQAHRTSKGRRSPSPMQKKVDIRETPLPSLLIEGMNIDQIWQQLDLRAARVCENLQILLGGDEGENGILSGEAGDTDGDKDEDEETEEDEDEDEEETEEMDIDEDESIWDELSEREEDGSSTAEGVADLRDEISEDDEDGGSPDPTLDIVRVHKLRQLGSHAHGNSDLNDGFFDLAVFNAETSEVEAKEVYKRKVNSAADEDSAEESEVDLFTSVNNPVADGEDGPELFYGDFFKPPRAQSGSTRSSKVRFHKRVTVKRIKAVGKGMPVSMDDGDSDEEDDPSDDTSS